MKNNILLLCILTVFIQNVQLTGQGFSDYKFCSQIAIDGLDTGRNKGAGITFNPIDNTFLICLYSTLYVVDMDGTLLSTNPLVGFYDVEGLEIIDDNTFVLVEEAPNPDVEEEDTTGGNIIFLPLPIPTNQSIHYPESTQIIHYPQYADNYGFESVAYDADNDILYWAKESKPLTIFSLDDPRSHALTDDIPDPASPWDINEKLDLALIAFTGTNDCKTIDRQENRELYELCNDIDKFNNISGMHFSSSNTLWILNELRDVMLEFDPETGDVLNVFDFNNRNMGKLQGITEGPSGEIIVIEHSDLYMSKFDDVCETNNDCLANTGVFFDFEQGMDLCNIEEVNYAHWRRQEQEWIENNVTKIEGATNGDYYFLLDEGPTSFRDCFAEGPEIDIEGIVAPVVKFDYILDNFTTELQISEDNGNTWEVVWTETESLSSETIFPLKWNQSIVHLDNYIDQKIQFRFKAIQAITGEGISALDAIEFGSLDGLMYNNDVDNDGVHALYDCDDNNPNIPTEPGTSCDDGNPDTSGDTIQADECTCIGYYSCMPFYELSGIINPGIYLAQDYIQSEGKYPQAVQ